MNTLIGIVRRHWLLIIPILLLLLFIGTSLDRNFYFGGDLVYPVHPQNSILKSIYLWEGQNGGGSFFKYNLLLWQGFFYVLSLLQIPIDVVIKILIVTIYTLGFIFSYLLYRVLFKDTKWGTKRYGLLFALFFLLNPAAILVVVGTWELYAVPICFYFLVKYLDSKNVVYIVPFAFFVNMSFFAGFPQAKPLLVFCIAGFFFLVVYALLRNIKIKSLIFPSIILSIITFLLNAFVLMPFMNDAFGDKGAYDYYTSSVITYNGDADLYSAAIPYTSRFYNSNLVDTESRLGQYLANPFFITWTFFILFFAILGIFFTQDKKEKKLLYLSLFAFLVFIFIAKGANPPFGDIYRWSLLHIPIAKLFRTSSTAIIGAVIFYTLLVTISTYLLSKKWKYIFPFIVVMHVVMLNGIYLGVKLDNSYQRQQKGITIPSEYFEMGKLLDGLEKDGKVLHLPLNDGYVTKKWAYTGQSLIPWITNKSLISNSLATTGNLDTRSFNELCSFNALYNIRYLLQEKDSNSHDNELKKDIDYKGKILFDNNYFKLQEANESCFLPVFHSSENTMYFDGPTQHLSRLSYLPFYENNVVIFTPDSFPKKERDAKQVVNDAKRFVLEISPYNIDTYYLENKYNFGILGEGHLIGKIIYPFVRIRPDSLLFPLVLWKEEDTLSKQEKFTRERLDLELFFASKRIKEITTWGVDEKIWGKTRTLFTSYMESAIQTAAGSVRNIENLELTYEYLQEFRKDVKEEIKDSQAWNSEKINTWMKVFDDLEMRIKKVHVIPDYRNLAYKFTVPKPGNYRGYMLLDNERPLTDASVAMNVSLNNNLVASYSAKEMENNHTIALGEVSISSLINRISLHIADAENLLINSEWSTVERMQSVAVKPDGIHFSPNQKMTSEGVYSNPAIYQEIRKWIPGATYILKIRHKEEEGASLQLTVREKKQVHDKTFDSWEVKEATILSVDLASKPKGDHLTFFVTADKNSTGASIYLSGAQGAVDVESVALERIFIPTFYFVSENTGLQSTDMQPATVDFTKIDPTKYNVTISNMEKPTLLVFSETFDKGWKIYGKDKTYISEEEHFLVNGYANAWVIHPQSDGKVELTAEFVPQKFFYIGTIVSFIMFGVCVAYGIYRFLQKKKL